MGPTTVERSSQTHYRTILDSVLKRQALKMFKKEIKDVCLVWVKLANELCTKIRAAETSTLLPLTLFHSMKLQPMSEAIAMMVATKRALSRLLLYDSSMSERYYASTNLSRPAAPPSCKIRERSR